MYTTHGAHIPGTRLGKNPLLRPVLCGGVDDCPDCMLEGATVTNLVYFREETNYDQTMSRVFDSLREAGASVESARKAMKIMTDNGILFRERKQT